MILLPSLHPTARAQATKKLITSPHISPIIYTLPPHRVCWDGPLRPPFYLLLTNSNLLHATRTTVTVQWYRRSVGMVHTGAYYVGRIGGTWYIMDTCGWYVFGFPGPSVFFEQLGPLLIRNIEYRYAGYTAVPLVPLWDTAEYVDSISPRIVWWVIPICKCDRADSNKYISEVGPLYGASIGHPQQHCKKWM